MLNVQNKCGSANFPRITGAVRASCAYNVPDSTASAASRQNFQTPCADNLKAYHPSFMKKSDDIYYKLKVIKSKLDGASIKKLENLNKNGILLNNNSNDGSTVLDNLYKTASEPRIKGLKDSVILAETISALENPFCITQKFGDIPDKEAVKIENETGSKIPNSAKHINSSSCVAASMEFNLAYRHPAEFARFAADLSSEKYSVDKKIKFSDFSENFVQGISRLREFNTKYIVKDWNNVSIKIQPDRNAIIRARVQTSYKNPGERSCVDVLIQSAILNLASQASYDSVTDERTGKFNADKTGLTDFEKNTAEQIIFETPKYSAVYQNLDENGYLTGYNCTHAETKQHILNSLKLGQNVIIGYTHLDENKKVNGGHEITILGYEKDSDGKGVFICNDTDDGINAPVKIGEEKLLPLIHHAGISKEALNQGDTVAEVWKEQIDYLQRLRDAAKAETAA